MILTLTTFDFSLNLQLKGFWTVWKVLSLRNTMATCAALTRIDEWQQSLCGKTKTETGLAVIWKTPNESHCRTAFLLNVLITPWQWRGNTVLTSSFKSILCHKPCPTRSSSFQGQSFMQTYLLIGAKTIWTLKNKVSDGPHRKSHHLHYQTLSNLFCNYLWFKMIFTCSSCCTHPWAQIDLNSCQMSAIRKRVANQCSFRTQIEPCAVGLDLMSMHPSSPWETQVYTQPQANIKVIGKPLV